MIVLRGLSGAAKSGASSQQLLDSVQCLLGSRSDGIGR